MARTSRWMLTSLALAALAACIWPLEFVLAGSTEEDDGAEEAEGGEPQEAAIEDDAEALGKESMQALHKKLDLDGDGKVSNDEAHKFAKDMWSQKATRESNEMLKALDASGDGLLQMGEHLGHLVEAVNAATGEEKVKQELQNTWEEKRFHAADTNGDGALDKAEAVAFFFPEMNQAVLKLAVDETMETKDTNRDGTLTAQEFWDTSSIPDDVVDTEASQEQEFKQLDQNGDGKVDLGELEVWESGRFQTEQSLAKLFEVADVNKDGHITSQELVDADAKLAGTDAQGYLESWLDAHEGDDL